MHHPFLTSSGHARFWPAARRSAMLFVTLAFLAACSTTNTLDIVRVPPPASSQDGGRYSALVIDASTGKTLYEANSNAQRYPASLTKMMTLYLLFEAMQQGRVTRTAPTPISAEAAR